MSKFSSRIRREDKELKTGPSQRSLSGASLGHIGDELARVTDGLRKNCVFQNNIGSIRICLQSLLKLVPSERRNQVALSALQTLITEGHSKARYLSALLEEHTIAKPEPAADEVRPQFESSELEEAQAVAYWILRLALSEEPSFEELVRLLVEGNAEKPGPLAAHQHTIRDYISQLLAAGLLHTFERPMLTDLGRHYLACLGPKFEQPALGGPEAVRKSKVGSLPRETRRARPQQLSGNWAEGWALDCYTEFRPEEGPVRTPLGEIVRDFKYYGERDHATTLAKIALKLIEMRPFLGEVDRIVPVPSSRYSGYEPPLVFSRQLAKALRIQLGRHLHKTPTTRRQKDITLADDKVKNVAGAFRLVGSPVTGLRVLLVDDLYDSGATLMECTRLLLSGGVTKVCVLALARTVGLCKVSPAFFMRRRSLEVSQGQQAMRRVNADA